jgi:ADP-heptose:LPS heptosyltransferase
MEILVINLMRLGDLMQTSPVLRRLRAEYPRARLTLLVMDIFNEPALLLDCVDRLLLFPSLTLAASLDGRGGWPEAYSRVRAWFEENLSPPPDLVINLTPNLLGAILTFAAGGSEVRGFAVDTARRGYTSPAWASYAMVVSKARMANPFNLVDLFMRGAGLTPDGAGLQVKVPYEAQTEADAVIKALFLHPDTALVGILPGASTPERQWPAENFAQTARLLRQTRPCHFFIFGSSQEEPLGEVIRSQLPAAEVTLCQGRTSIPVLAAHLKRLDLLLTNDTGPMHLAAAVGTPVLALFLATARVLDTGPAGKGHIAIEPDLDCHPCLAPCSHPRCHAVITPEAVAGLGLHLLEKKPLNQVVEASDWRNLRLYYSDVDPLGYQVYLPLVRRPLTRRAFWLWAHRLAWAEVLDRQESQSELLASWVKHILSTHYLPRLDDLEIATGQQVLGEILELASQGEQTAGEIAGLARQAAAFPVRLWQKLEAFAAIDLHLKRLAVEFPELASVVEFFFQEQRKHGECQIVPLAQELARAYRGLHRIGTIFLNVIQAAEITPARGREFAKVAQEVHKNMEMPRNHSQNSGWRHAGDYQ